MGVKGQTSGQKPIKALAEVGAGQPTNVSLKSPLGFTALCLFA